MMTWTRLKLHSLLDNLAPRQGKDNYNTTPSCSREACCPWTTGKGRPYTCKAHCQVHITINRMNTQCTVYTQCIRGSNTVLLSRCTLQTAVNCANTVLDEWAFACYNCPRNNIRFHLSNFRIISLMAVHSHNLKL